MESAAFTGWVDKLAASLAVYRAMRLLYLLIMANKQSSHVN
jgi:hypothetical protein